MRRFIGTALVTTAIASCAVLPAGASARVASDPVIGSASAEVASPDSSGGGFEWGDAGVGAAGALVVVAALAGASGLRRRPLQG